MSEPSELTTIYRFRIGEAYDDLAPVFAIDGRDYPTAAAVSADVRDASAALELLHLIGDFETSQAAPQTPKPDLPSWPQWRERHVVRRRTDRRTARVGAVDSAGRLDRNGRMARQVTRVAPRPVDRCGRLGAGRPDRGRLGSRACPYRPRVRRTRRREVPGGHRLLAGSAARSCRTGCARRRVRLAARRRLGRGRAGRRAAGHDRQCDQRRSRRHGGVAARRSVDPAVRGVADRRRHRLRRFGAVRTSRLIMKLPARSVRGAADSMINMASRRRRSWGAAVIVGMVSLSVLVPPAAAATAAADDGCAPVGHALTPVLWAQQLLAPDAAWPFTRGAGQTVAVLDSGVDAGQPQLRGRVAAGYDAITTNGSRHRLRWHRHPGRRRHRGHQNEPDRDLRRGPGRDDRAGPRHRRAGRNGTDDVQPAVLARGIDWAVASGVDVIDVSVSIDRRRSRRAQCGRRRGRRRHHRGGRRGRPRRPRRRQPDDVPGRYPDVIGVGAIDSTGLRWAELGARQLRRPRRPRRRTCRRCNAATGSSTASSTALAAGFVSGTAALVRARWKSAARIADHRPAAEYRLAGRRRAERRRVRVRHRQSVPGGHRRPGRNRAGTAVPASVRGRRSRRSWRRPPRATQPPARDRVDGGRTRRAADRHAGRDRCAARSPARLAPDLRGAAAGARSSR